jgi:hypothetical protein
MALPLYFIDYIYNMKRMIHACCIPQPHMHHTFLGDALCEEDDPRLSQVNMARLSAQVVFTSDFFDCCIMKYAGKITHNVHDPLAYVTCGWISIACSLPSIYQNKQD